MKLGYYLFAFIISATLLASCHHANSNEQDDFSNELDPPVWTFNDDDVELGTTDFYTFDIERDYSKLNERMYKDPSKKMYVENSEFNDSINITYNGDKATVSCSKSSGASVQTDGAHVIINTTKDVTCNVKGNSENGSLKIVGENKVLINLKGVNLKNPKGPAISNQSKNQCFLVTLSQSVLSDDSTYTEIPEGEKQEGEKQEGEKQNGCICSKGSLAISGKAPLKIVANGADAIHSSKTIFVRRGSNIDIESHAASAIKAKNKVKIEGGVININSTGRGGHGITAKEEVLITGGRTTIISNTGAGKDGKNSRGIKSDSLVNIYGGIVRIKESSIGGKGIRAVKFHAKNCMIDVLTFGTDDKVSGSKNRGIKAVEELRIDSARVRVRTENGWNEGLSCRYKILINNSLVEIKSRDDAISAGEKNQANIEINNSRVYADSGMDSMDSNGTININSGLIFVMANSHLCRGLDCDNKLYIGPDATVVSLGQQYTPPAPSLLKSPVCLVTRPHSDTQFCLSTTGKDDNIVSFNFPKFHFFDSGIVVLLSTPEFKQETSYDFCRKADVSNPKHTFHGLMLGGTASNKSVAVTHSFNKFYNNYADPVPKYVPPTARKANTNATATDNANTKTTGNTQTKAKDEAKTQAPV
ncbi:MAG: carbohydrate-binding domain-containing protein [Muribaculaceae bacterium]|nr:carbohydrate-binding domain-containing protein [Muribaculaceae bacterium]